MILATIAVLIVLAVLASVVLLAGVDPADPGIWDVALFLSPLLAAAAALVVGSSLIVLAATRLIELSVLRAVAALILGLLGGPITYVLALLLVLPAVDELLRAPFRLRDTPIVLDAVYIFLVPVACGTASTLYAGSKLRPRAPTDDRPGRWASD